MLLSPFALALAVLTLVATSSSFVWLHRDRTQLRDTTTTQSMRETKILTALREQLAAATQRATAAESDLATLLQSAKSGAPTRSTAARTAGVAIDAQEFLKTVQTRATQLKDAGQPAAALDEYVKAYRELQALRPGSSECQSLMGAIKYLGRTHPPALTALATLRDSALAQWQATPDRRELVFELALLNERLDQGNRTLPLYDALPAGDINRGTLAMVARQAFIDAGRYTDALAGKSFGQMMSSLEAAPNHLPSLPADRQEAARRSIIDQTLTNLEVLTGAGHTEDARLLTEKLLAFDNSAATRSAIQERVTRVTRNLGR